MIRDFRTTKYARRGGTLVLALIVVLVVGMMAGSFMQLNSAATRRQALAVDNKLSFYVAEAGLTESYLALLTGKPGDVASPEAPAIYGEGLVWAEAEDLAGGFVRVESTGMCGRGRALLSVVFERSRVTAAQHGIFSNQDIVVPEGSFVDGYDSSVEAGAGASFSQGLTEFGTGGDERLNTVGSELPGDWWEQSTTGWWRRGGTTVSASAETVLAEIKTNGSITVNATAEAPTQVSANMTSGPSGSIALNGSPQVEGDQRSGSVAVVLPQLVLPSLTQAGDRNLSNGVPHVQDPGVAAFEDVTVGTDTTLQLVGPLTLLVDTLTLGPSATLVVDDRLGPVEIYATRYVDFQAGSTFQQLGDETTEFEILVDGNETSTIASTGELRGFVYSPDGTVVLGSTTESYGSVVADALVLQPGATLHFDKHLATLAAAALLPRMVSWRIAELGELSVAGASDPFQALGVDRASCVPLSDAAHEPTLYLGYTDWTDAVRTFDGPWDDFRDWQDIKTFGVAKRDGVDLTSDERQQLEAYARQVQMNAQDQFVDFMNGLTGGF